LALWWSMRTYILKPPCASINICFQADKGMGQDSKQHTLVGYLRSTINAQQRSRDVRSTSATPRPVSL
jgi:hypothetical protein